MSNLPQTEFQTIKRTIEVSVSEKRWNEVRTMSIELLGEFANTLSASEEAYLRLALLRSEYYLGDLEVARDALARLLKCLMSCDDEQLVSQSKYYAGMLFMALGEMPESYDNFNECYVFSKIASDHAMATKALNMLARLAFVEGKLHKSLDNLETCIAYCSANKLRDAGSLAKRNAGRVLMHMGRLSQSSEALEASCVSHNNQELANLYLSRARLSVMRGDAEAGREMLEKGRQLIEGLSGSFDFRLYYEYAGLLEYYSGNYSQAREYYQQVLDMPEPTASAVAQTLRMLTDVCIAEGKYDEAMKTAKRAEKAITKINERIELGALYRAYGQIYTPREDYDTARDYFGKSIALLREIGARYELALTYFACGESEAYNNDTRMRHLESARLLFDEMGVPKRVEQVQSAIDELKVQSVPDIIVPREDSVPTMVAASSEMKRLVSLADKVAKSNMTVLLTGETGTGKDLFARYIHEASGRGGEFVTVNAAAIPHDMIESELFGCCRGAFTGALESRAGLFEKAESGTFYLNEIADATPAFQAKLLEVLETHEVRRLGETDKRHVDFRLIAATNRDIEREVDRGRFRLDLYHRLNEISFDIPPLRERNGDIRAMVTYFMSLLSQRASGNGHKGAVSALADILSQRQWSGNVRELRSEINRLWIESHCDVAMMATLAQSDQPHHCQMGELANMLEETGWNRRETARRLGMSEATVRNWIKRYNLA